MTSPSDNSPDALTERLREANEEFTRHYPGESGHRQPVHTVYGGAHLFKSDTAKRLGSLARRSLDQFAPDFLNFARAGVMGFATAVAASGPQKSAVTTVSSQPGIVSLQELEKRAIQHALQHTRGDRTVAAQLLGIGRTTLYRKLKEYSLD